MVINSTEYKKRLRDFRNSPRCWHYDGKHAVNHIGTIVNELSTKREIEGIGTIETFNSEFVKARADGYMESEDCWHPASKDAVKECLKILEEFEKEIEE